MQTTSIGVALYKIKSKGRLEGKWSVASDSADPPGSSTGEIGTEIATFTEYDKETNIAKYRVDIFQNGHNIFKNGTLEIKKLCKNSYQLWWKIGGIVKFKGYGVKRKKFLAANYWAV